MSSGVRSAGSRFYSIQRGLLSCMTFTLVIVDVQESLHSPHHLQDDIIMETTGNREKNSTYDQLKTSIYLPVLDCILSELNKRFSNHNLAILRSIQHCSPQSSEKLLPIINNYNLNKDMIFEECSLAKHTITATGRSLNSIDKVLLELLPLKNAFPNLVKLLQIIASCERSFSSLKRIKTWLRTTMTKQRLVDLAIISIKRDLSAQLSPDEVLNRFAAKDNNRRIILL